ncbi:MAG: phosphoribosylaminoimidazolesuccinocarboxamide synthase, partial [Actinomycetota bacterium]|nr:phosphoribosylaminoimidazolesuccinocarboxamide synthase [Actinomycetota bacterium]
MTTLAGWTPVYSGKVRELYIPESASNIIEANKLLIVATDRVSAFDHILTPEVPGKGTILSSLTRWWCEQLADIPNHLSSESAPEEVADRAMVVEPLTMFPVECVVRGYLAGSGWKEYQATSSVCGIALPPGLSEGDELPHPLFTPATKAPLGDHDESISFDQMVEIIGEDDAVALRDLSLSIYSRARDLAHSRGVILADTKLEFGRHRSTGAITLGDEVLTSDSSRYWDGELYSAGGIDR